MLLDGAINACSMLAKHATLIFLSCTRILCGKQERAAGGAFSVGASMQVADKPGHNDTS